MIGILGQAAGDDATGRPAAHDDVVPDQFFFPGSAPSGNPRSWHVPLFENCFVSNDLVSCCMLTGPSSVPRIETTRCEGCSGSSQMVSCADSCLRSCRT